MEESNRHQICHQFPYRRDIPIFKASGNDILQVLPILGESGSEVSYFIPEPRNFAEVTRLSEDIRKLWLKAI